MRVIFMGKNKKSTLEAIRYIKKRRIEIAFVVAKKDNSKFNLWKECESLGIPVITSCELNNLLSNGEITSYGSIDLVISFLYWEKIKKPLLELPRLGCINFHPAPLPEFRGLGGYNIAILEGLNYWGVSAHFVDETIDTGDLIQVIRFEIDPKNETALSLERKSQQYLVELFREVIEKFIEGKSVNRIPQGEGRYISKEYYESLKEVNLYKENAEIINRKIRAFWFPPYDGAFVRVNNSKFTLINNQIMEDLARMYENQ